MKDPKFGMRVKDLRKELGLEQKEIAAQIGVSYSAYQKYEAGHVPSLKNYEKIVRFFENKTRTLFAYDRQKRMIEQQNKNLNKIMRNAQLSPQYFGDRVKAKRDKLKKTQSSLANEIGVSANTIQNYESGQLPKGEHAVGLAIALNCSIDWLLTGNEYKVIGDGERVVNKEHIKYTQPENEWSIEAKTEAASKPKKNENGSHLEFKVSDALAMTARVLESGTSYATALYLNIQHFERAVRAEEKIRQVSDTQQQLEERMLAMQDQMASVTSELKELRAENSELKERLEKGSGSGLEDDHAQHRAEANGR